MNTKSWLLIVSMMLMVACHKGGNAQVADIPMVKIDTVGTTTGESTLQFPGKVVASQQVNASFRVAGTLKRVCVEEGSRVKAGQLLAEMDTAILFIRNGRIVNNNHKPRIAVPVF